MSRWSPMLPFTAEQMQIFEAGLLARPIPRKELPPIVGAREAARLLGITVEALRKRVQRGQLPRGAVVQTGRRYMFRRERLV